jgi:hypothetical protein
VVCTSRDLRANPKVAWDIALAVTVVSPRAHDPTLLDCDGVFVPSRDLLANPKVAWDIALAVIVASPRTHGSAGNQLRTGNTGCAQRKGNGDKARSAFQVQITPRGAKNDEGRKSFHNCVVSKVRTVRAKRAKKSSDLFHNSL